MLWANIAVWMIASWLQLLAPATLLCSHEDRYQGLFQQVIGHVEVCGAFV